MGTVFLLQIQMSNEGEASSIPVPEVDPPVKLSKNQQRRQKRYELVVERRKLKRKEERTKLKERRRERSKVAQDQSLVIRTGPKYTRMEDSSCRIRICFDCRYDSMMSDRDIRSLQKQIAFGYSANRRSTIPCQFYITNVDGALEKRLDANSARSWDIHFHTEPLETVFPHEDILYLTSDSENVLSASEPLDERTVYVIGGIVDHNSRKGMCHQLAVEKQWRHARLPIDEFIKLNTRRVLACNHVMDILLNYIQLGDWKKAFEQHIPKRKQHDATEMDSDVPQTLSPDHPDDPHPCAEIHERRKEVDESENLPLLSEESVPQ